MSAFNPSNPFDLPKHTLSLDNFHAVEEIFEVLFVAGLMTAQEFGAFMLARKLFRNQCELLLAQIWARGGFEADEGTEPQ
jgi:hypothetical protein